MIKIKISKTLEAKIKKGYPWVFKYQLQNKVASNSSSLAVLYDHKNQFLAIGLWDSNSDLCFRVLNLFKPIKIDTNFFLQRLAKALLIRKRLEKQGTNGYRILNGENDGFPGLILDRYANTWVMKVYTASWFAHLDKVLETIKAQKKVERVVLRLSRNVEKSPHQFFDGQILLGPKPNVPVKFQENGLNFYVDVIKGQKTGFFLDQRDNRLLIKQISSGLSVLNVFSYTGGFSIYAISGGCKKLVEIDSNPYALNYSLNNLKLNFPENKDLEFQQLEGDAFKILQTLKLENAKFDLVILDPPAFARKKKHKAQAIEAYKRLTRYGVQLVKEEGRLFSASCSAHVSLKEFTNAVKYGVSSAQKEINETCITGHAIDHPHQFTEAKYLKSLMGWICEKNKGKSLKNNDLPG